MRSVCAALFISILLITPVSAQTPRPTDGRSALLPDISLIGSIAGAWFEVEPAGDQGENPERTGANLQGVELALQSIIDPYVRGDFFLLFHEDAVEIEDATITSLALPGNLQLRAGKMLAKMGRQNAQHLEQFQFVDQSRLNRYFLSPEGFSELGAEFSLLIPVSWFSEFSFEFLQGENAGNFDGTRRGDFAYLGHWKNAADLSENLTAQLGLSGAFGFNNTGVGNLTRLYAGDLYLRWKPNGRTGLKWQTEYFLRSREEAAATTGEGGTYSQIVYQFARRWEAGARYELIGFPQEAFREQSVAPMLCFHATEFFRIRGQYSLIHIQATSEELHEAFLQLPFNMG
ncbi:MAG: hypothetical protein HYY44_05690, partial [Deltaproteobacteria bacterium]|nr:hypothetical protein [Deltaproteobacteria bacterium]